MCARYGKGLLKWMNSNEQRWREFLDEVNYIFFQGN